MFTAVRVKIKTLQQFCHCCKQLLVSVREYEFIRVCWFVHTKTALRLIQASQIPKSEFLVSIYPCRCRCVILTFGSCWYIKAITKLFLVQANVNRFFIISFRDSRLLSKYTLNQSSISLSKTGIVGASHNPQTLGAGKVVNVSVTNYNTY